MAKSDASIASQAQSLIDLKIPRGQFVSLCLHDVRDEKELRAKPDPYAISTENLAALFDWMQESHWHPISLQQVIDAQSGKTTLPDNAVLLSWDDGLISIYSRVYPLLLKYKYPALFAIQTGWITAASQGRKVSYQGETAATALVTTGISNSAQFDVLKSPQQINPREPVIVTYNGVNLGASDFVSWAQLREMVESELVSLASHTHNQHHGILSNPQGNVTPACITRQYLQKFKRYETDQEYRNRLLSDLMLSSDTLSKQVGYRPKAIVWPYGATNQETDQIAVEAGLGVSFNLADRLSNVLYDHNTYYGRLLLSANPNPFEVEAQVSEAITPISDIERAVQIDLDYVYDPDPKQVDINLGLLLDRILELHVRTVYLQAFADPEGTGTPKELYFPNSVMPVRADLFNRVAWQLQTRAGVNVLGWLPMMAYHLPDRNQQARLAVKVRNDIGQLTPASRDYERLSPFLPETTEVIGQIFADFGKNNPGVFGVFFHDDAYLAEDEDASVLQPEARWPGTNHTLSGGLLSPAQKTQALIDFGDILLKRTKFYCNNSKPFLSARNLYPRVVLDPAAEAKFAQALAPFIKNYDRVVLMAMPYLDGTSETPEDWLNKLLTKVAEHPNGLRKVVFELQAKNWINDQWIDGDTLKAWMRSLIRQGGVNLAYYPDDFYNNQPPLKPTFAGMSLNDLPSLAPVTKK